MRIEDLLREAGVRYQYNTRPIAALCDASGDIAGVAVANKVSVQAIVANVVNRGSHLWILGYKTENRNTKIHTLHGGRTELIGTHVYSNTAEPPIGPLFRVDEGVFSVVAHRETWFGRDRPYDVYVEVDGKPELLRAGASRGRFIPLATSHAPKP
jgi:hypothetical protein